MHKIFIVIIFILLGNCTYSQQYNFSNVSTNKGLPSSECYGLLQDHNGYIWVRTLNGLCKYNGKKFRVFTKKDGLKSNATYALYEDKKGRIWFSTSSSHIGYIFNDSIHYVKCSEDLAKENGFGQKIFYKIILDKNDDVYIASHERAYKINAKNNYNTFELLVQNDYYLKLVSINNQLFFIPDTITRIKALVKAKYDFYILDKKIIFEWDIPTIKRGIIRTTYPCIDTAGNIYFNINHKIFLITKNGIYKEYKFDNLVYHIFIDKDNNLWVGQNSGGLHFYRNCDLDTPPKTLLKNESISGIIQDFEGGIWASSLSNGLFYCKNLHNENLTENNLFNYKPELLKIIDSVLYLTDYYNGLVTYNLRSHQSNFVKLEEAKTGIIDIDKSNEGFILSGRNSVYKVNRNFKFKEPIIWNKSLKLSSGSYNTIVTGNQHLWGVSKNYITNYTSGNSYKIPSFGNDIIEFDSSLYIATKNELLQFFSDSSSHQFIKRIENENIIKLLIHNNTLLILCRDGSVYQLKNKITSQIFKTSGISFNDACLMQNSKLLIASNYGIYTIDLFQNKVQQFNTNEGLLDNEIFKIASFNNLAYYATIHGIGIVDIERANSNNQAPKIIVKLLNVNNNSNFSNNGVYNYNSSIHLKFDIISFKDNQTPKLFYFLKGYDSNWKSTESGEINYFNLPDNNYTLQVYGINSSGTKSEIKNYHFKVSLPFFKTWWFIVLVIITLSILIYLAYKIIYAYINKRELKKTKINKMLAEYQLMGLKAQMNPHFIFNCLNSIQKYVLENDSKLAYTYMAKFSKLIRFVLDLSDKTFVSLSDEINLVRIYAELEQLRFDQKFNFEINIQEEVKADDVLVPSLLIQPYLENAIWHGIMNLNDSRKGEISINIKSFHDIIEIVIHDNGVGRSSAKLMNQKTHRSKGISINEKRIEAINYLLKSQNATIEIVDLYNQNNQPLGTKVIIKLPLKYDE